MRAGATSGLHQHTLAQRPWREHSQDGLGGSKRQKKRMQSREKNEIQSRGDSPNGLGETGVVHDGAKLAGSCRDRGKPTQDWRVKQGHQSPACVTCTGTPEKKEFDAKKGWHHELGAGKVAFALKEGSAVRKEPAPLENKHPWKSHCL